MTTLNLKQNQSILTPLKSESPTLAIKQMNTKPPSNINMNYPTPYQVNKQFTKPGGIISSSVLSTSSLPSSIPSPSRSTQSAISAYTYPEEKENLNNENLPDNSSLRKLVLSQQFSINSNNQLNSSPNKSLNSDASRFGKTPNSSLGTLSGGVGSLFYSFLSQNPKSSPYSSIDSKQSFDSRPSYNNYASNESYNNFQRPFQTQQNQSQSKSSSLNTSPLTQQKLKKLQETLTRHYSKQQLSELGIFIPEADETETTTTPSNNNLIYLKNNKNDYFSLSGRAFSMTDNSNIDYKYSSYSSPYQEKYAQKIRNINANPSHPFFYESKSIDQALNNNDYYSRNANDVTMLPNNKPKSQSASPAINQLSPVSVNTNVQSTTGSPGTGSMLSSGSNTIQNLSNKSNEKIKGPVANNTSGNSALYNAVAAAAAVVNNQSSPQAFSKYI